MLYQALLALPNAEKIPSQKSGLKRVCRCPDRSASWRCSPSLWAEKPRNLNAWLPGEIRRTDGGRNPEAEANHRLDVFLKLVMNNRMNYQPQTGFHRISEPATENFYCSLPRLSWYKGTNSTPIGREKFQSKKNTSHEHVFWEGTEKKRAGSHGQEKNPSSSGRPPLQVASAEGVSEAPSPSGKILICITV